MTRKNLSDETEQKIEELVEQHREHLREIFSEDTFNLTFDEREKLISGKMKKETCKVLEKHIKDDPKGICEQNHKPDESCLCDCNTEALLCRDEDGNIKIFEREIKTKDGPVMTKEFGYDCPKCRSLFFSTKKKT